MNYYIWRTMDTSWWTTSTSLAMEGWKGCSEWIWGSSVLILFKGFLSQIVSIKHTPGTSNYWASESVFPSVTL